jgi:predicted Rossmann fold flavoprotein
MATLHSCPLRNVLMTDKKTDVLIIGGGAAGLMCAITAGERGRDVILLEHNEKVAGKILISGGGRCNFTNLDVSPIHYQSENPHFCRSALSRFTPADFIARVEQHGIAYHEKTLGQLFCDERATLIIDMLLKACRDAGVEILTSCTVKEVSKHNGFEVLTSMGTFTAESLVIATGGLSIPKMGATDFGYSVATQFGHSLVTPQPALAPFTLSKQDKERLDGLSGVSARVTVTCGKHRFTESMLFTHRGLSGPAMLQINSYWRHGNSLEINLLPEQNISEMIMDWKTSQPKASVKKLLLEHLPKRLVYTLLDEALLEKNMNQLSQPMMKELDAVLHHWNIIPAGDEGYAKAEVTRGGVNTNELSSKTMESTLVPGLYFIGEVVDVTGWLGGFNFQWAWASGYCAGLYA